MARYLIPLAVFAALGLLLAAGLKLDPREIPSPLIDRSAPAFVLPQLDDPQKLLSSEQLLGQVSVLNVWASWCVACRDEHPLLLDLAEAGNVALYGLNYKDLREDALRWLDYFGDPYRLSVSDEDGKVGIDFGVYGVPETFVIDQQGVIRYKHIGPITERDWQETIQPLLEQLGNGVST